MEIHRLIEEIYEEMVGWRRKLHNLPFIGIALSKFTRLPCLNRLRAVLFHVSFITSTVKDCRVKQVTVRQIPLTAMLSPKCISSNIFEALMDSLQLQVSFCILSTLPISSIIPVNMDKSLRFL